MIRPITCLTFLLACGSGLYLYQSKHRVELLDRQIAQTARSTDALREQTRMLNAEWTLLNDPERLRQLANQFLTLQTVAPGQFTSLADLDGRLPSPLAPGSPADSGTAPLPSLPVPVASDTNNPAGVDEGRAGNSKIADVLPARKEPVAAPPSPVRLAASMPAEPPHPVDRRPSAPPRPVTAPPRMIASPQPSPEQHVAETRSVDERSFQARRPVVAVREQVPAAGGSLLGMAHGMAAPPMPLPLPRPMPVSVPQWSYSNGG